MRVLYCLLLLVVVSLPLSANGRPLPVKDWIHVAEFRQAILSPTGKYLAVVMTQNKTSDDYMLAIMPTQSVLTGKLKATGVIKLGDNELFAHVFWVNDDRIAASTARYYGGFDRPYLDGKLYAMNAQGGRVKLLMGAHATSQLGYRASGGNSHMIFYGGLLSLLPKKPNIILVKGWHPGSNEPAAYRLDVNSARAHRVVGGLFDGGMLADHTGIVRLQWGLDQKTGLPELLYRRRGSMDWKDVSSLVTSNKNAAAALAIGGPIMFTPDNKGVYMEFWSGNPNETMGLYRYDFDTGKKALLYANPGVNVGGEYTDYSPFIESFDHDALVGLRIMPGKPEVLALDPKSPPIQLLAALTHALPGEQIQITSATRDGNEAIVKTWSDTIAPAFYLYSGKPKPRLTLLFRETGWIKPHDLSPMKPISFKSRDGLTIHGYLTVPRGVKAKNLAMIVYVHGGPHGLRYDWGFDPTDFDSVATQILANHGYAVLALNYRGSGGYGFKFQAAGYRHWGDTMQNDLADGVKWAVSQGYADPKRVCIFGASYGGYAALMSAERFPDLYQCAVGYDGVYDLSVLKSRSSDVSRFAGGRLYENTVLGSDAKQLEAFSPAFNSNDLKIPVFLLHGGRDERAPVKGYDEMVAAIKKNGTPLQTLYYPNEGHAFYTVAHREKAWREMLDFFDKYIGHGATASHASP